jgi:tRNA (guanine-N7-)-methyltransferase
MRHDQSKETTFEEKFFGRRKGRPLGDQTLAVVDTLLPALRITPDFEGGVVHPSVFFETPSKDYGLEIGFGGGEHLAFRASQHREMAFIGVEVFLNGVASLLLQIGEQKLSNIKIYPEDARPFLNLLEPSSLSAIYVLFPDPWPKARHHRRRIIQADRVALFAHLLKPGGELLLATDVPDYLAWMEEVMAASSDFRLKQTYTTQSKPAHWPLTRYEEKALKKGRFGTYLLLERL